MGDFGDVIYHVQVRDDDRWTIYTDAPSKLRAITEAKTLLGTNQFDAVKVTEVRGRKKDVVVFEEEGAGRKGKTISITPVEDSPVCRNLEDFYSFEARKTLGRLFRKYLDDIVLTPSEFIHSHLHVRTVVRNDDLYIKALQSIGGLQAKLAGEKSVDRMNFIERRVDQIIERSRDAEDIGDYAQIIADRGAGALVETVTKKVAEELREFYIRAAIAADVSRAGDWQGKLLALIEQAEKKTAAKALPYIDEVIAEIFDGSEAVQELLGYQRDLATAMLTIIALASGSYDKDPGSGSTLDRLSKVMAAGNLPRAKAAMIERVSRALAGTGALTKGAREDEREAFEKIVTALSGHQVISENGELSEAATLRARIVFGDEFTNHTAEEAIDDILGLLANDANRFGYLLDLCNTDFGAKNQDHVISAMAKIVDGFGSAAQLVGPGAGRIEIVRAAAGIRDRLLSTGLPDNWRRRFAKKIYGLLLEFDDSGAGAAKPKPAKAAAKPAKSGAGAAADQLARQTVAAGDFIFKEGDAGDAAYFITKGRVAISRKAGTHEVIIAHAGPGSIVGEMALIDSSPRMASVKAEIDTEVTVIPAKDLEKRLKRLEKFDPVMRRLVAMFVQRIRDYPVIDIES